MPPSAAPSNIRAFVHWKEPAVYGGEEIECIITFRNIARPPRTEKEHVAPPAAGNGVAPRDRRASYLPPVPHSRKSSVVRNGPSLSRATSAVNNKGTQSGRGHRPALSLNVVALSSRGVLPSAPLNASISQSPKPDNEHNRSVSIISIGGETLSELRNPASTASSKRPTRSHVRSASLQHLPRHLPQISPVIGGPSPRQPSPLYEASTPPAGQGNGQSQSLPVRPARRMTGTVSASSTPQLGRYSATPQKSTTGNGGFKFPPDKGSSMPQAETPRPTRTPSTMHSSNTRGFSPRPHDSWTGTSANLNPISRVMSVSSVDGTPRNSSDLYSMSNHSDETLTSEILASQQSGRLANNTALRKNSRSPANAPAEPETLMMAYAQTVGQFTLDSGLINAAPFDEVKRKGVQGEGGVVGVERFKRSSNGMFGGFSWGNIGESLGGLLGGDEFSSMAQMKATAGSKSIPLLSTPQSLLFVNLQLAPGEGQSFSYKFPLPRGLPPSHRGRAIKISYNLSIGVQRPGDPTLSRVEIPFRVLGSYGPRGNPLTYDLMSPFILMHDAAHTSKIYPALTIPSLPPTFPTKPLSLLSSTSPQQGLEDFLRYTERLHDHASNPSSALLSPTSPLTPTLSRKPSLIDQPPSSTREAIDLAILRSTHPARSPSDPPPSNRFNIARSGQPVAVLHILRPAFRLGESVIGTIDFPPSSSSSPITPAPVYAVHIDLESAEAVTPTLALRSPASIARVTRRVHASRTASTFFASRIAFHLAIPASASPSFDTAGVQLAWRLRVEFTTEHFSATTPKDAGSTDPSPSAATSPSLPRSAASTAKLASPFLEPVSADERGVVAIAREKLLADTFEIAVPLVVYGAIAAEMGGPAATGAAAEAEAWVV